MSSKARRIPVAGLARPYDWNGTAMAIAVTPPMATAPAPPPPPQVDAAQVERDAFMKGYAQGERAGAEAAAARGEAVVRRLSETVDELRALRAALLQKAEQQVVQLALAIARRIVSREVTLDPALVAAMGRVAIDRLNGVASATIRLHPDDHAAVMRGSASAVADGPTTIVADPMVRRGGCIVQSDFGIIDVGVDAQIQEIARTLFGDSDGDPPPAEFEVYGAR
jgi:flagellar assembly protein FliH